MISDEPFFGYVFSGAPPYRHPRVWFLDRHLTLMLIWGARAWTERERAGAGGVWSVDRQYVPDWPLDRPLQGVEERLPGLLLRYQRTGPDGWSAVWRITDTVIEHVRTFGRPDDTWRLGLWPD